MARRLVFLILALAHLVSLSTVPAPFVDEAWFANRAWSLVTCGVPLGTLDYGVLNWYPTAPRFYPLLPVVVHAAALRIAGGPSLLALRIVSLAAGALVLLAVWRIASSLYDRETGAYAAFLLGLSHTFIHSSHLARYDILAAAVGFSGVALYVSAPDRGLLRRGLAGLLCGLATAFHPFASVIGAGLFALWVYDGEIRRPLRPQNVSLALGAILGLSVYPVLHVLPNVPAYFEMTALIYGPTHVPMLTQAWAGLQQTVGLLIASFGILAPVVLAAIVVLVIDGTPSDRRLLALSVGVFLAFTVLVRNKLPYYSIHLTPPIVMCLAAGIRRAIEATWNWSARVAVTVLFAAALLGQSALVLMSPLGNDVRGGFPAVERRLATLIKPGDSVIGPQTYWFGLPTSVYYSWEQLIYLQRRDPRLSVGDALAVMRPDILIRDRHLETFINDRPGTSLYTQLLRLPRTELENWLASHADLIADFDGQNYGRVRVYRLRWAPDAPALRSPAWGPCVPTAHAPLQGFKRPLGTDSTPGSVTGISVTPHAVFHSIT